jgi:hypothetical protein
MAAEVVGQVSTVSTAWAVFSVIGGTLVGSTISTVVAFLVQRRTLKAAQEQRDSDRFEKRKAIAYSFFFKMMRIHSTLVILNSTLVTFVDAGKKKGFKDLWQMILPLGNPPDKVKFNADEMALILSLDIKLFDDMGPYDDVHNGLIDMYEMYGNRRMETLSKFGVEVMNGATGTHNLNAEQIAWLKPRAYELNQLAEAMVVRAAKEAALSKTFMERSHALFVKEFKFNNTLEFKNL